MAPMSRWRGERGSAVKWRGAPGWRQVGVSSRRNCKSIALWSPSWTRETIMNGAEALERAGRGFRQRLVEVERDDWARPTPCDEWSVRDLVNHVVGGNVRYVMILAGEPADAVRRTSEQDWLGSDPLRSFDDAFARVTESFSVSGILEAAVRHPKLGTMTADQLRVLRVNELTAHAWDLARAIDSDDRLDEQVVSWLLERLEEIEPLRSTVAASRRNEPGPAEDRPAASPQGSLLRLLGRAG
jgi:uncharacterized protein (TIGR03086 family)